MHALTLMTIMTTSRVQELHRPKSNFSLILFMSIQFSNRVYTLIDLVMCNIWKTPEERNRHYSWS